MQMVSAESVSAVKALTDLEHMLGGRTLDIRFGSGSTDLVIATGELRQLSAGIHQFRNVTIEEGSWLTVAAWDGKQGGTLELRVSGILTVAGTISVSGCGFRGGVAPQPAELGAAMQGETSFCSPSLNRAANRGGGGGGCADPAFGSTGGAGAGYGTAGQDAQPNTFEGKSNAGGQAGCCYGDEKLSVLHLGSGGGAGHPGNDAKAVAGNGGAGAGALLIVAKRINITKTGRITADGARGGDGRGVGASGGGGGSGGSIWLEADEMTINGTVRAHGGGAGAKGQGNRCSAGGAGGHGHIRIVCPAAARHIDDRAFIHPAPYLG